MRVAPILVAICFLLSALLEGMVFVEPAQAASSTIIKTTNPPAFGVDVGPAKWSFKPSGFSWASGISNMTMNLPTLTLAVASTNCAVAQSGVFSHNLTTYIWTSAWASACNGRAMSGTQIVYVKNVTGAYNQKEIIVKGSWARAGSSASIVASTGFPLVTSSALTACGSCLSVQNGQTAFDFSKLGGFVHSYNNSTKTLSVSSVSSTAASGTYIFDPIALDGSGKCTENGTTSICTIALTTANANDVIIVVEVCASGGGCATSDVKTPTDVVGITFTQRAIKQSNDGNGVVAEYYGIATGMLSAAVITCKNTLGKRLSCNVFGISGGDTSTVFDSNGALPCLAVGTSASESCTISTSNANDMILEEQGFAGTTTCTKQSTYTLIQSECVDGNGNAASAYLIVSSTQSSIAVTWTTGVSVHWIEIVDAVKQLAATVTQPIKISIQNSAPTETLTITGACSGAGTIVDDNVVHNLASCTASTSTTFTVATELANSRYRFCSNTSCTSSSTAVTTWTFTTCASGTCTEKDNITFWQLAQNYTATPLTPSTWDAAYSSNAITGTYLGVSRTLVATQNSACNSANTAATFATTQGGGAVTTKCVMSDYNKLVSMPALIGNTWGAKSPSTFTDTTANHVHNVNYIQGAASSFPWFLLAPLFIGLAWIVVRRRK